MEDCIDCKSKQLQIDNLTRILKNTSHDVGQLMGRIAELEGKIAGTSPERVVPYKVEEGHISGML